MPVLSQLQIRSGLAPGVTPDLPVRIAPPLLQRLWGPGTRAMTLPWAIYLSPAAYEAALAGDDSQLVAHEAIHVGQWRRLGWVPFLVVYLGEYLRGRLAGLPHEVAYRSISLEQEAEQRSALVGGER
jgi:hypothetical protein